MHRRSRSRPAAAEERAPSLPAGTVTFLMSDVEGSTRRWEQAPEAMAGAIARHYDLLDQAIVSHRGVRPVEQGEGWEITCATSAVSSPLP